MFITTKILIVSKDGEYWEDYTFNLSLYVCHERDGDWSVVQLKCMEFPVTVQLSFEEITEHLQILNTFETVNLN